MTAWLPQPVERASIFPDAAPGLAIPSPDTRLFFDDELDDLEATNSQLLTSQSSASHKSQRWLLVRPVNGLCNRLRCIISAMLLAKDLGRTLILDWRLTPACNCEWQRLVGSSPGIRLDLERVSEAEECVAAAAELQRLWLLVCGHAQKSQFQCLLENYVNVHQEYFRAGLAYYLDGQSNELDELLSLAPEKRSDDSNLPAFLKVGCLTVTAYEEFYPRGADKLAAAVADRSMELNKLKPARGVAKLAWQLPKHTLAVHVRRTDHQAACRRSPLDLFFEEVDKHNFSDQQKIFLATDDPTVEDEFRRRYGDRLLLQHKRTLDRGVPEGIEDAFVDLLLLSQGVEIIGSYESSFSDIASLFRRVPLHVVDGGDTRAPALCHKNPYDPAMASVSYLISEWGDDGEWGSTA